jgi:hypothetical protein
MLVWKDVPAYAYRDFWSQKPKRVHWFYKLLSYVITPLSVCIFNNAHTIPVWHDTRLVTTFRESMRRLSEGNRLVIFPEKDEPYNKILYAFQDRFIDLAKMYYKRTGRALQFAPMYIAPALKTAYLGEPIAYDPAAPIASERARICAYLQEEITRIARSLPEHTVVPYRNIPRRDYPKNTDV